MALRVALPRGDILFAFWLLAFAPKTTAFLPVKVPHSAFSVAFSPNKAALLQRVPLWVKMKRAAITKAIEKPRKNARTALDATASSASGEASHFSSQAEKILEIEADLLSKLEKLPPFTSKGIKHVYNPLIYAAETHQDYVKKWGGGQVRTLFVGMNPGPFGMSQNGVPFGDTTAVRDWLQVKGHVLKPPNEHPKRPVMGLECARAEVSGTRFWGYMEELSGEGGAAKFFERNFVYNYCPLAFMTATAANVTPDKLAPAEKAPLLQACDEALHDLVSLLKCDNIVGVGQFATTRAKAATSNGSVSDSYNICTILHPSPASPQANRGWREAVAAQLSDSGVRVVD